MQELLRLLENNARYSVEELAVMLGRGEAEIVEQIEQYERDGVIRGYTTIVDWEKTDRDLVSARIELKVTPEKSHGFEEVAAQIAAFDEVQSLYLMSGGYDLAVTVTGKTFKDIAYFVAYRLATMDAVQSTSTHFILRRYKERGKAEFEKRDDRGVML